MRLWRFVLLLGALCALGLGLHDRPDLPDTSSSFVSRSGMNLVHDGKPFRFIGVNSFQLAEDWEERDEYFSTLAAHGIKVVRLWAFQKECGPNGTDFSKLDAIVASARRHHILLLPVIENHWSACTYGSESKPMSWYKSGWRTEKLGPLPYRDYIRAIGAHFQNEPQILAWQLVNEPEIYPDTKENSAVLRKFVVDAARELKEVDPNHLISLGLLGIGQPSTTGTRFRALHNLRVIDIVSSHDYGYIREPLPGWNWSNRENILFANLCDARSLKKPFVTTESGIPLAWVGGDRERRAALFRAKLHAFFAAGGCGYLLWNYEPTVCTEHGFDATDPVMEVLREVSVKLADTDLRLTEQNSEIDGRSQL